MCFEPQSPYAVSFTGGFLGAFCLARSLKRAGWILHSLAFVCLAVAGVELLLEFEKTNDYAAYPHSSSSLKTAAAMSPRQER